MTEAPPSLTCDDYTVGWISPLPIPEQVASRAMLDEIHGDPTGEDSTEHDNNAYVLGSIGKFNIVVAGLPAGQQGDGAAARVAKDMLRSYHAIKIILLVGIGGGVPGLKLGGVDGDIRLGDVVVSQHSKNSDAVIQYDYGKSIQGRKFERSKGSLNKPPEAALTAIAKLMAKHVAEGNKIASHISEMIKRYPRLAAYDRPEPGNDRPFKTEYPHKKEDERCDTCCSFDESNLLYRGGRGNSLPAVHYGTIGSANNVMKDGILRDEWAKNENIICFEMEAAGMMDGFPCLVIRGIADYADSHKDDMWQPYAASTAAAYAKELILAMNWKAMARMPSIADINNNIAKVQTGVAHLIDAKILNWLSDIDRIDPSLNYKNARELHISTTGDWLLKGMSYTQWIKGEFPMLWLYGIPGCGKTVISSTIIDNLLQNYAQVAYFYFDFEDIQKQTVEGCIRSLLRQLSAKGLPRVVRDCYEQARECNAQPSLNVITKMFKEVLQQAPLTFLVFDALDECREAGKLMKTIAEIKKWELAGVRILATSRREPDIIEAMKDLSPQEISLETALVDEDIKIFVKQGLNNSGVLKRWSKDESAKREIEDALIAGSKGMFQWAKCQLDALAKCLDKRMLRVALKSLPKTLDETYTRILEAIDSDYERHAKRILRVLTCSARPLQAKEVVDMIAVDMKPSPRFDGDIRLPQPGDILRICSSLVTMEPKTASDGEKEVRLAHYSVKEYLVSSRIRTGPAMRFSIQEKLANIYIAKVCLAYLLQFDKRDSLTSTTVEEFPLARYAAQYWTQHAQPAGKDATTIHELTKEIFLTKKDAYTNWIRLCNPDSPWEEPNITGSLDNVASPLYYASRAGLVESVKLLLKNGVNVNDRGGTYVYALHAACHEDYEEIVQLLLENGADINMKDSDERIALFAAVKRGHETMVRLLVNKGSAVNAKDKYGETVLWTAACSGHEVVVCELLKENASIEIEEVRLPYIFLNEAVERRLIEEARDVKAKTGWGRDALFAAVRFGQLEMIRLLLKMGADLKAKNKYDQTILHELADDPIRSISIPNIIAAPGPKEELPMLRLLVEKGVDLDAKDESGQTALHLAALTGDEAVVQLFLEMEADVEEETWDGRTALWIAAASGKEVVVELLLDKGADVEAKDRGGRTVLCGAAAEDHEAVVKLLILRGADVTTEDEYGMTALHWAAMGGHESIVQLLMENGADVEARDYDGNTPLDYAVEKGHEMVEQLLDMGVCTEEGQVPKVLRRGGEKRKTMLVKKTETVANLRRKAISFEDDTNFEDSDDNDA